MLLIAATNQIFLGVDIYFAHLLSGTIVAREWIPIIFGPFAGVLLLFAGLIAIRFRTIASSLATLVMAASILVGVLGSYFHTVRAALPAAPIGSRISVDLLIWAPPFLAPLSFAGVAILAILAAWKESPPGSGILDFRRINIRLPFSKTRGYLIMLSLGILVTLISSVLDHAREGFDNIWLWLPTLIAFFTMIVALSIAFSKQQPSTADLFVYFYSQVLMVLVGLLGLWFHIQANLISENAIVVERFLRGAPFMAPLLFSNMGMIGLAILWDPSEKVSTD